MVSDRRTGQSDHLNMHGRVRRSSGLDQLPSRFASRAKTARRLTHDGGSGKIVEEGGMSENQPSDPVDEFAGHRILQEHRRTFGRYGNDLCAAADKYALNATFVAT